MTDILELFGEPTSSQLDWHELVQRQVCPFLNGRCTKIRKSQPEISIGTCSVTHGTRKRPMMICPFRLLERNQIFFDCLHLLRSHEPGCELHVIPEVSIPGGNVDYMLASVRDDEVIDFVGVELQTIDTTGSVWPARLRFLSEQGVTGVADDRATYRTYGMNWKMTAKTTLVQLHHKIQTFSAINRHLVLVVQDDLIEYLQRDFNFDHVSTARLGDAMQFHAYSFARTRNGYGIKLSERLSTDAEGVAACLGLKAKPELEFDQIVGQLERKLSSDTLLRMG